MSCSQTSDASAASCPMCTSTDYTSRIYDSRRSNFYAYACPFNFAGGNSTFGGKCAPREARPAGTRLSVAERTTLRYTEPNSYAEYMRGVHDLAAVEEKGSSASEAFPWSNGPRTTSLDASACRNCRQCSIVPNCGGRDGEFSPGCAPQPQFKRRARYNGGAMFKPASRLPRLDRYQWSQPESLYYFDTDEERAEAFDGIYNGNVALRAKFNFQNPKEQQRLWYGIRVTPPPPRTPPTPIKAECAECTDVPVPYYRNYLESQYACGCNKLQCSGGNCARGCGK